MAGEVDSPVYDVMADFCRRIGVKFQGGSMIRYLGTYAQRFDCNGGSIVFVFVRDTVFAKLHVDGRLFPGEERMQWNPRKPHQAADFMERMYRGFDEWK